MFGLRIAAEPPRPSRTKKGKLVGFDVNGGVRFSTYARHYADKEMRAALADPKYDMPEVKPEKGESVHETEARAKDLKAKADFRIEGWHKALSHSGLHDPDRSEVALKTCDPRLTRQYRERLARLGPERLISEDLEAARQARKAFIILQLFVLKTGEQAVHLVDLLAA
jgi:hypothetical protein